MPFAEGMGHPFVLVILLAAFAAMVGAVSTMYRRAFRGSKFAARSGSVDRRPD